MADGCCQDPPPEELLRGVHEFNRGEFFQCHETLEELWKRETSAVRDLYRGILQIAVGFHHLARGNYRGAGYSLEGGLARLRPFRPECQGVQVDRLVAEAERAATAIAALGPQRTGDFDTGLIPVIRVRQTADERK